MKRALLILVALAVAAGPARAGWDLLYHEVNDGNVITDLSVLDERVACAAGMVKSPSSGNSEPLVMCTADGGGSWRKSAPTGTMVMTFAVHAVDASRVLLATMELSGFQLQTKIYRSDDGGRSWGEPVIVDEGGNPLLDLFFLDRDRGWATGSADILRTADGGASWQAGALPDLGERTVNAVWFLDAQNGWAVAGTAGVEDPETGEVTPACCGALLRSGDGGASWQIAQDGFDGALGHLAFADAQHGWAVGGGTRGLILATSDGGVHWAEQTVPSGSGGPPDYVADVAFPDALHGYAVGNVGDGNPTVMVTEDGGASWTVDATYLDAFAGLTGFDLFAKYSALTACSFPAVGLGMVGGKNVVVVAYSGQGFCPDRDGDGFRDQACGGDDCDDANAYVSPGTEELCNGLDENCDGVPDEAFDLQRDPRNCGECGFGCQPAMVCWDGDCTMDCPTELTRCGQTCADTDTDLAHCGGCDQPCAPAHAAAACTGGVCSMGACQAGWVDLDGDDATGCEYACTPAGAEACNGLDDDCDGQVDEDLSGCNAPDGGTADGGGDGGSSDGGVDDGSAGGCAHAAPGSAAGFLWLLGLGLLRRRRRAGR